MKLPLDIFQLLGVAPQADEKKILTMLDKRLTADKVKEYSQGCREHRKKILVQISEVLMDAEKRKEYENTYMADAESSIEKGYEVPSGSEVAGLLLLLEAEHPRECTLLANHLLERWKSDVGIPRSAYQDLELIIDEATLAYADELRKKRYYESAAEVILERLQQSNESLSTTNQKRLVSRLDELLPYRILDLLNRSCSEGEHTQGIELLERLVRERGGLETVTSKHMDDQEFKSFFRQIRSLLTVQEQIDLFKKWSRDGSEIARFLVSIALVAAGFAQRKPERLKEALGFLDCIATKDLEPIKANIYLLLGNVQKSNELLTQYGGEELNEWCKEIDESRLGQQCAWCKEWLSRDVLEGYRDIDTEPDLEAYFCDRDVLEYIESNDGNQDGWVHQKPVNAEYSSNRTKKRFPVMENLYRKNEITVARPSLGLLKTAGVLRKANRRVLYATGTAILAGLIILALCVASQLADTNKKNRTMGIPVSKTNNQNKIIKDQSEINKDKDVNVFYEVLEGWLALKVAALSGENLPAQAARYASLKQISNLDAERRGDRERGERQVINVSVKKIRVIQRTANRVRIEATLDYGDRRLDRKGKAITITPRHVFKKNYTLVNNGSGWVVD